MNVQQELPPKSVQTVPVWEEDMPSLLSDAAIRKVKPKKKPYKMFDVGGLFLLVTPKRWG